MKRFLSQFRRDVVVGGSKCFFFANRIARHLRSQHQIHARRGPPRDHRKMFFCCFCGSGRGGALPKISEETCFCFWVESVRSVLNVFHATIFLFAVARCCVGILLRTQWVSRSYSVFRVWSVTKGICWWVGVLTLCSVCVWGFVTFRLCQDHVRRLPICVFVMLGVVLTFFFRWTLVRFKAMKMFDCLSTPLFFGRLVLCWQPTLVTTPVSIRYSMLRPGRNAKHIALTGREHRQSSVALLSFSCLHLPPKGFLVFR